MRLQSVYTKYKQKADFYWIYIREAHASDGRRPARHVEIAQPKTFDRREEVAEQCCESLDLDIPLLVDDIQDSVSKAYNAMPDRLFILDSAGKIAYRGARGPKGFKVDEMENALKKALAKK